MSDEVFNLLKDLAQWASGLAIALAVWAYKRNEKEHDDMRLTQKAFEEKAAAIKQHTSDGYSVLNDRMMTHLDAQAKEMRAFVMAEDAKLVNELGIQRGHVAKIFDQLGAQERRSEDRHVETLGAIHTLANQMHAALATKADK
jgi:hypothetical protein